MLSMASIFLCALGNRCIGSGYREIGFAFMTLGVWMGLPLLALPFVLAGLLIWRCPSPRPWLDLTHGGSYQLGVLRGVLVLPLALVCAYSNFSLVPLILGMVAVFAIPAFYWLDGKTKPPHGPKAEVLSGAILGMI